MEVNHTVTGTRRSVLFKLSQGRNPPLSPTPKENNKQTTTNKQKALPTLYCAERVDIGVLDIYKTMSSQALSHQGHTKKINHTAPLKVQLSQSVSTLTQLRSHLILGYTFI